EVEPTVGVEVGRGQRARRPGGVVVVVAVGAVVGVAGVVVPPGDVPRAGRESEGPEGGRAKKVAHDGPPPSSRPRTARRTCIASARLPESELDRSCPYSSDRRRRPRER